VHLEIRNIVFDAGDARALAKFWSALTGWNVFYDADPEVLVAPTYPNDHGVGLVFIPVADPKSAKNRVHLDLGPTGMTRDEAVTRALTLGAKVLKDHRSADGSGWVTLTDPEGNEFCIERSLAERGPQAPLTVRLS
jgi:predicted enzyme related to lactoylglutathione lyase